ncbi:MAG: peptidyl-prolyl cis-trans isomerase [Kiritimatiellia bacterium]|jgi:parvulin-like peptidyl-prolyl isomerase|nr:peptidyl-prolyl cis-trans isomerase [Kiritimatiellia bacterium]
MRVFIKIALLTALLSAVPAGMAENTILFDGVAAYVNEHVITVADVLEMVGPIRQKLETQLHGEKLQARMKEEFARATERAIERKLMLDSFEMEGGQLPEWAVDKRIEEIVHDRFGGDEAKLKAALADDRLLEEDWRQLIRERLIVSTMRSTKVTSNIRVSAQAVKDAYDSERDEYFTPGEVRLRMIVLHRDKVSGEDVLKKAKKIRDRITSGGEDFAKVAVEVSKGTHAADGGDWGWVKPEFLRSVLADATRELKPGKVSELIDTEEEIYILKVEERKEASVTPFGEVQSEIESELRRAEGVRLQSVWIESLRRQSYVKIFNVELY